MLLLLLPLHVVVLPDHLPFASHDRTPEPTSSYPTSHVIEAWEPYADPHEREVIKPFIGG